MRWLYHLIGRDDVIGDWYEPGSLATEGFVHCSFRDDVVETARIHFAVGAELVALQIDPRRIQARIEVVETPRGAMPHVHGAIPKDAIRARIELDGIGSAPDGIELG